MSAGAARATTRPGEDPQPLNHDLAERLVLAGLAQGSLAPTAIGFSLATELFRYDLHQELLCTIESVHECIRGGARTFAPWRVERRWDRSARRQTEVPVGIHPESLVGACRVCGHRFDGYVRWLYQFRPAPREAEHALTVLRCRAAAAEDAAADKRRALQSLADLVPASLVALEEADLVEVLSMLRTRRERLMEASRPEARRMSALVVEGLEIASSRASEALEGRA